MSLIDLKEELKKNKPTLGTKTILKLLLSNNIKKIYLASNCRDKQKVLNLAKIKNVEVISLEETNKQVGTVCKKSFNVSVLGFK